MKEKLRCPIYSWDVLFGKDVNCTLWFLQAMGIPELGVRMSWRVGIEVLLHLILSVGSANWLFQAMKPNSELWLL